MKTGIVGLGLMGGSLGLSLRDIGIFTLIAGHDINPMHRRQAIYLGLVDECLSLEDIFTLDVIFLCVPVDSIIEIIGSIKNLQPNQLVIDFGGTKHKILKSIPPHLRGNFVSLHPMCGTENFGPKAAFSSLYKNQIVIFVDVDNSNGYQLDLARDIFIKLHMKIIKMDSVSHDKHTAFISHMPHILSYALANVVLKQENPYDIVAIAGGGFRDMSRISKSSGSMWSPIVKQNKSDILDAMNMLLKELNYAIELIESDDFSQLEHWMNNANKLRDIL